MTGEERPLAIVQGRVKWFDPVKGFGFVVAGDGGSDILLHANVLRNFGQSSVADGAEVSVRVQLTSRGAQAVEVLSIVPPVAAEGGSAAADGAAAAGALAGLPLEPARVKWYDKVKGFGFANVFGRPADVFIHAEVLRQSGLADLAPGEAIALRIVEGRRGQMAAQVVSWDVVARQP